MTQVQINEAEGREGRMRGYVMRHLAEVCREFADNHDDILEALEHPQLSDLTAENIERRNKQAEHLIIYMGRILDDLKSGEGIEHQIERIQKAVQNV